MSNPTGVLGLDITKKRMNGETFVKRGRCIRCGQPTLKSRVLCSEDCRTQARMGKVTITIDGVAMRPIEHAAACGVPKSTLYTRIKHGWPLHEAVTTPPQSKSFRRKKKRGGE